MNEEGGTEMIPVVVRKVKIGEGIPKICVPIVGRTETEILGQARLIRNLPADIVEWRADWYQEVFDWEKMRRVLSQLRKILDDIPILFTFRTSMEGGEMEIGDQEYLQLNQKVAETEFVDLIDVEVFSKKSVAKDVIDYARMRNICVIASNHDFVKTSRKEELITTLQEMERSGADILKIAVMPTCEADVETLLDATKEMAEKTEKPLITMSMSKLGEISRTTGERYGSAVTFGTAGEASAPGQIPVRELKMRLEEFHEPQIKKG